MTDSAEQFTIDVQTALATLLAPDPPVLAVFGALKKNEHRDAPLVNWWLETLEIEEVGATDSTAAIFVDKQKLGLRIWHTSVALVRRTLHDILAAARDAGYGSQLEFADRFEWSEQGANTAAHLKRYFSVQGAIDIRIPVPAIPPDSVSEVVIETINSWVRSSGEEQVHQILTADDLPANGFEDDAFSEGFE